MAVVLALLGALLFALAGAAEHRAAARLIRPPTAARCAVGCRDAAPRISPARRLEYRLRRGLRLAAGFLRSPLWVAGWAADALGFGVQAGALHLGSLSVVQPLLVTTLLFSLPLAALGIRRPPRWADWVGGAAACAGLALVLSSQRPTGPVVHPTRLFVAALVVLAASGGIVLVVMRSRAVRGRAVALAVATGMMFALSATLTKLVTDRLAHTGIAGTAAYWPAYALAAVALTGLVLEQVAFSTGSLSGAMAAITISDPLVSYGFGVVGFGEPLPRGTDVGLSAMGLGLLAAGVIALAHSPLLAAPSAAGSAAGPSSSLPEQVPLPARALLPATASAAPADPAASVVSLRPGADFVTDGLGLAWLVTDGYDRPAVRSGGTTRSTGPGVRESARVLPHDHPVRAAQARARHGDPRPSSTSRGPCSAGPPPRRETCRVPCCRGSDGHLPDRP